MTMLSFRVNDDDAAAVELWASRLHMDRSELLREALRRHLSQLASALEVQAYEQHPITDDEKALSEIADWGPAEDWADWADATG
jgi:predicted transcriptional regulator